MQNDGTPVQNSKTFRLGGKPEDQAENATGYVFHQVNFANDFITDQPVFFA